MRTVLHVGCGKETLASLPGGFQHGWREIRFDIDPNTRPDILGSTTDMAAVEDGSVDAVFSSHNIEHVRAHEVPLVLANFRRVLRDGGFAVVTCPDIQLIAVAIAKGLLEEPLYVSEGGPISALDILYGHSAAIARGSDYMAHRTAFTAATLAKHAAIAGFATHAVLRRREDRALWMVATKQSVAAVTIRDMIARFTPGVEQADAEPAH